MRPRNRKNRSRRNPRHNQAAGNSPATPPQDLDLDFDPQLDGHDDLEPDDRLDLDAHSHEFVDDNDGVDDIDDLGELDDDDPIDEDDEDDDLDDDDSDLEDDDDSDLEDEEEDAHVAPPADVRERSPRDRATGRRGRGRQGGNHREGRSSRSGEPRLREAREAIPRDADKPAVKKEMLINVAQAEECRIAILEDGVLEELYTERASQDNYTGNIYKGKIVNLEPSIQAAFVDFGVGRNGFLHISDVEPQYYRQGGFEPNETFGPDGKRMSAEDARQQKQQQGARRQRFSSRPRFKPPIQEIFQRGDEVVVQVIKEGIGNKGPTLSTYISIPGRYLVLMPALGRVGVSRKIEDEDDRRRLRDILLDLNPPKGLGFIVRTAGQQRTRRDLARDLSYLLRLWKVIARRIEKKPAPVDIYEESDMMIRTIRDILTADVDSIYIDEQNAYDRAKEFLQLVMPRVEERLHYYDGQEPLFHKYNVEQEIANIHRREVSLKGGGSIVIDQTEALVAIDVNSGSFRTDESAEETAYQLNLSAAREIARQLRLRDLGGVIVNDFIDMRKERHRRNVERALRDAMRRDRARTKILRTSPFGLIEMTRQRIRPSLKRNVFADCPCCNGRGMVKTAESMAIEVIRTLYLAAEQKEVTQVTIHVNDEVAAYLNNKKRKELANIEEKGEMVVQILGDKGAFPEALSMMCKDAQGREVKVTKTT